MISELEEKIGYVELVINSVKSKMMLINIKEKNGSDK